MSNDLFLFPQVGTFQEYVKPELYPTLSDFCVKLTGITQVSFISPCDLLRLSAVV